MKNYSFDKRHSKFQIEKYILGLLILLCMPNMMYAKPSFNIRKLLNPIHLNFAIGYGRTYYNNQTVEIAVFEKDGNHYLYIPSEGYTGYLISWFGGTYVRMPLYENDDILKNLAEDINQVRSIGFEGKGNTIPIIFSGHIDIYKKLRLELGGSICIHYIKTLQPHEKHKDKLGAYTDPIGRHYVVKAYLMPSFKILENAAYTLLLNTQVSLNFTYGNIIKDPAAIHAAMAPIPIGIGLTLEKHISEYFSMFGRLIYEHSNSIDKFLPNDSSRKIVNLNQQSVFFQVGFTINCPEIPRCPIPHCDIEVKHKHAGKAYRGVSMFTGKNDLGYKLYSK
jgi:hypothetical protein